MEKRKSGNRFILVMADYENEISEVFLLKCVKAKTVALCSVFAHELVSSGDTDHKLHVPAA